MLAYMVARVGDPDALLQEQRAYLRDNHRQASEIANMEKAQRRDSVLMYRTRVLLEKNGIAIPDWFEQWKRNEEITS